MTRPLRYPRQVVVKLTEEQWTALQQRSEAEERTPGQTARMAIRQLLDV